MAKISIIGAGSWGTALGLLLCNNGHDVTICSENEKGDHRRFLTIDFSSETVDGKRILTVEDISSVPF